MWLMLAVDSVDQQPEVLGVRTGELALKVMKTPEMPSTTVLLPPRLVVRQSSVQDEKVVDQLKQF